MKTLIHNLPFVSNSVETLNFRDFMKKESTKKEKTTPKTPNFTAYSLYINPLAFFDLNFILAAGAVVLIAIIEKKLASHGIGFASFLSGFLYIAFPVVAVGSFLYLISKLGVFL